MQARDVMTREVVTVGPQTAVRTAAEAMADGGFAALPVVDDDERLVGIVAEADLLRGRLPEDPRLHLHRDVHQAVEPPPLLVHDVMTRDVRAVDVTSDAADVAGLFVETGLRSVPVTDHGRLAGIVSRRDLLRVLVRSDEDVQRDVLRLVEVYTGDLDAWAVTVHDGVTTVQRVRGAPQVSPSTEERALTALVRTIGGVVSVRVLRPAHQGAPPPDQRVPAADPGSRS